MSDVEKFKLYPKQKEAIFDTRRICVIEGSVKSGKTFGGIVWLICQALTGSNTVVKERNYWWVSPLDGQAEIAFRRTRQVLNRESLAFDYNLCTRTIILSNGSVIWFKSKNFLGADNVFATVVDDASRVSKKSWIDISKTLEATKGDIRVIGRAKGHCGWFYQLVRKAKRGALNMAYHRITASDAVSAGILDIEEIEDAKRELPELVFRELYLS
jgi:hypothetical protein